MYAWRPNPHLKLMLCKYYNLSRAIRGRDQKKYFKKEKNKQRNLIRIKTPGVLL